MKLADDATPFHLAHGIEGHQTIRIFLHKPRIVTAVGDFVFFPAEIITAFDAIGTPAGSGRSFDLIRIALRNESAIRDEYHLGLRKIFDARRHRNRLKRRGQHL